MPKYVIERELAGIGNITHDQVLDLAQKSSQYSGSSRAEDPMAAQLCDRRHDFTASTSRPTKR